MNVKVFLAVFFALEISTLAQSSSGVAKELDATLRLMKSSTTAQPGYLNSLAALGKPDEVSVKIMQRLSLYDSPEDRGMVIGLACDLATKTQTNRLRLSNKDFAKELAGVVRDDPSKKVREHAAIILLNGYPSDVVNANSEAIKQGITRHKVSLSLKEIELYSLLDNVSLADMRDLLSGLGTTSTKPDMWVCSLLARHGDKNAEAMIIAALENCPGDSKKSYQDDSCQKTFQLAQHAATDGIVRYMAERIYCKDTFIEGSSNFPQSKGLMYALTICNIMRDRSDFPFAESSCAGADIKSIVSKWCSEHLGITYPVSLSRASGTTEKAVEWGAERVDGKG